MFGCGSQLAAVLAAAKRHVDAPGAAAASPFAPSGAVIATPREVSATTLAPKPTKLRLTPQPSIGGSIGTTAAGAAGLLDPAFLRQLTASYFHHRPAVRQVVDALVQVVVQVSQGTRVGRVGVQCHSLPPPAPNSTLASHLCCCAHSWRAPRVLRLALSRLWTLQWTGTSPTVVQRAPTIQVREKKRTVSRRGVPTRA